MRKFAYRQTKNKEHTNVSKTESTLVLSGSSPDTRGSWPIKINIRRIKHCHIFEIMCDLGKNVRGK